MEKVIAKKLGAGALSDRKQRVQEHACRQRKVRSCHEINYADCAGYFFENKEENAAVPRYSDAEALGREAARSFIHTWFVAPRHALKYVFIAKKRMLRAMK